MFWIPSWTDLVHDLLFLKAALKYPFSLASYLVILGKDMSEGVRRRNAERPAQLVVDGAPSGSERHIYDLGDCLHVSYLSLGKGACWRAEIIVLRCLLMRLLYLKLQNLLQLSKEN